MQQVYLLVNGPYNSEEFINRGHRDMHYLPLSQQLVQFAYQKTNISVQNEKQLRTETRELVIVFVGNDVH